MHLVKVREDHRRNNLAELARYDNYVAVDWAINNMAIAVTRRDKKQMKDGGCSDRRLRAQEVP